MKPQRPRPQPPIFANVLQRLRRGQRSTFLVASGISTAGSFAGLTAKGWLLMHGNQNPLLLALHFAMLTLPTLVVSGWAGVLTDEVGSERVLIRAQWGLFGAAVLAAIAIPMSQGALQALLLLASTLGVGIASAYELTARNKYCALLVERPDELGSYLTSFSVIFNVAKLVGPPIGGLLLATTGPFAALALDAASYLVPIATLLWLMAPNRSAEQRSQKGQQASMAAAWRLCGPGLRRVLVFCALACLVGFFHPGLAPLMASELLGPSPQSLGLFTSVIAAGSICGGVWLQRRAGSLSRKPGLLLGASALVSGLAQIGLGLHHHAFWGLFMAFLIGAGSACLLSGTNMIIQVHSPQVLRGRMAGLGQIAFLGGGGMSGLLAAGMSLHAGLWPSFVVLGSLGAALGLWELLSQRNIRIA